jgi:hypothetical protein
MEKHYNSLFADLSKRYNEEYSEPKIIQKELEDGSKTTFLMIRATMRGREEQYMRYVLLSSENHNVALSTDGGPLVTFILDTDKTESDGFKVLPENRGGKKRKNKSIRRKKLIRWKKSIRRRQ